MSQHLFILDSLSTLNYELDTSIRLAHAFQNEGEEVHFCTIFDISSHAKRESVVVRASKFDPFGEWQGRSVTVGSKVARSLHDFSTVHMRKDPPFDLSYISACWILGTELEPKVQARPRILNNPQSIIHFNEKLLSFAFKDLSVPGILTGSVEQILVFIEQESVQKFIMKPLHLYGGRGVESLDLKSLDQESLKSKVENFVNLHGFVIVQHFLETVTEVGEIRGFFAGGKAVAWCLKKPKVGEYLANTRAGATLHTWSPDQNFKVKLETMASQLWNEHGLYFIGIDVLGDKVSEINITSPRLLLSPEDREGEEKIFKGVAQDLLDL